MEVSAFTLKLIILLVPGGLGALILERLTIHKKDWTPFKFVAGAILVGLSAYFVDEGVVRLLNLLLPTNRQLNGLTIWTEISGTSSNRIPYLEVGTASLTGIVLGLLLSKADNKKLLNNWARKHGFSDKYGDENLFTYYLRTTSEYVYVRCPKQGFTYLGLINAFSETDEMKELVLEDVIVFDYASSVQLYEVRQVYLSLLKDDVIIELPKPKENEQETAGQ